MASVTLKICFQFILDMFRVADHLSCEEILNCNQQMFCSVINVPQLFENSRMCLGPDNFSASFAHTIK